MLSMDVSLDGRVLYGPCIVDSSHGVVLHPPRTRHDVGSAHVHLDGCELRIGGSTGVDPMLGLLSPVHALCVYLQCVFPTPNVNDTWQQSKARIELHWLGAVRHRCKVQTTPEVSSFDDVRGILCAPVSIGLDSFEPLASCDPPFSSGVPRS